MFNTHKPSENDLPSSSQLLKSTIIALAIAGVLLLCVVIPAEYGTDPTGVGKLLGLKKMGEIKAKLKIEAINEEQKVHESISTNEEKRESFQKSIIKKDITIIVELINEVFSYSLDTDSNK